MQWRPDIPALVRQLQPLMDQLEAGRVRALERRKNAVLVAALFVATGVIGALALIGRNPELGIMGIFLAGGCLVLAMVFYHYLGASHIKAYQHGYKSTLLKEAVRAVAPGVDYQPAGMISQRIFEASRLFRSRIDSYSGEDCFHGKVGATQISFSELHVQRKEKSEKHTRWVTVFQGIFMVADFHKNFRCAVTLEPDFAEATFGFLGRGLQGLSGDLIRLESPEFERAFKVRGSDPVEARYLLTPDMQERFLDLRRTWSSQLCAAFRDSSLVLAIPKSGNWFEVDVSIPANRPEHLTRFFSQLLPLLYIPTKLDLDTRIWTKE